MKSGTWKRSTGKSSTGAYFFRRSSLAVLAMASAALIQIPASAYAFETTFAASLDIAAHPYASHLNTPAPAISSGENREDLFHVSNADVGAGAENFIDSMATRALEFLGNTTMSQEQKKSSFRNLLNESFDLDTIGRFVLGRHWKTATTQQRSEYLTLFRKMVVEVYAKRFSDYKGQKFETRGHRTDGDKDTVVTSYIVPGDGPEVQVDWRVRYKGGRYQIVDVIVEGVSMSVTQRSDFSAVIQRGGGDVQVLLAHLRTNTGNSNQQ